MSDPTSQPVRPLKMRNLRSGAASPRRSSVADEPPISRGMAGAVEEFDRALDFAIDQHNDGNRAVVVFRLRVRALALTDAGVERSSSGSDAMESVMAILDQHETDIVFHVLQSGEMVGFVSHADQVEAERILGRLYSALSGVLASGPSTISLAPKLGAAFIGDQINDTERAKDAARVTVGQTSVSAPFLLYNDYVYQRGDRQFQIVDALPRAVAANEFDLQFQPRAATKGNHVAGLEAFARWVHPTLGAVTPREFLASADRLDLMSELGRRLRDRAVGSAVSWFREAWLHEASLWLNVSYSELCRPGFASSLGELREQYPDVRFGIEVKDGPLLDEPVIVQQLEPVRRLGIDIVLDNVGASAISLGRIQRLPLAGVNLDGSIVHSLVSDPSYQHLAAAICEAAHSRGLLVTACQAETREQLTTVRSLGIDQVQGQVLSAPIPAGEVRDLLSAGLSSALDRRGR